MRKILNLLEDKKIQIEERLSNYKIGIMPIDIPIMDSPRLMMEDKIFLSQIKKAIKILNCSEFANETKFPAIDKRSWFYKNCKRQRKSEAKICQCCPFRKGIEEQEKIWK